MIDIEDDLEYQKLCELRREINKLINLREQEVTLLNDTEKYSLSDTQTISLAADLILKKDEALNVLKPLIDDKG